MNKAINTDESGTPFMQEVFRDTGCYQSLITEDLTSNYEIVFDKSKMKVLKAVNNNLLGFLSRKSLQPLGIIPRCFLHIPMNKNCISESKTESQEDPMHIHPKNGPIKLLPICNPRKTPYTFQDAAKATLDEKLGIIE
ncbi:unnamed protein product [Lepeophtheirus salmonis]|uniref:(salmon louse) hypothetical protein n=1 Tax=Lepeophtheirus salmonis TaxID=72036 RepID=A0A7R8D182_LEPSM|nr:unnamed protein product [Lepeophtheirus salmonis]CAF2992377.1 unnamed protein product [Lepeophtheirus salmonis]